MAPLPSQILRSLQLGYALHRNPDDRHTQLPTERRRIRLEHRRSAKDCEIGLISIDLISAMDLLSGPPMIASALNPQSIHAGVFTRRRTRQTK